MTTRFATKEHQHTEPQFGRSQLADGRRRDRLALDREVHSPHIEIGCQRKALAIAAFDPNCDSGDLGGRPGV